MSESFEPDVDPTGAAYAAVRIPEEMAEALSTHTALQRVTRPSGLADLRDSSAGVGAAPYPELENPVFAYLLEAARQMLEHGADPFDVVVNTAANAWFEGHIEGAYRR